MELTYFKTRYRAGSACVDVTWETASERNSSHFVVERSATGHGFQAVAEVAAAGTSTQLRRYDWRDLSPLPEMAYYRLRQVDRDGTAQLSKITVVSRHDESATEPFVWPAATAGNFHVLLDAEAAPNARIAVFSALGRHVYDASPLDADGAGVLELRNQPPGLYLVRITTQREQLTRRIVLTY